MIWGGNDHPSSPRGGHGINTRANPLLNFLGHSGSGVDVWLKPETSALPVSTALRRDFLFHWDHKLLGLCEARAPKGLISLYLGRPGWRKEELRNTKRALWTHLSIAAIYALFSYLTH